MPVFNLSTITLDFKIRDRITKIDLAYDVRKKEEKEEELGSEEPPMCATIQCEEPKSFANPKEKFNLGVVSATSSGGEYWKSWPSIKNASLKAKS